LHQGLLSGTRIRPAQQHDPPGQRAFSDCRPAQSCRHLSHHHRNLSRAGGGVTLVEEGLAAMRGCWRLIWRDPRADADFNLTIDGFWRSFAMVLPVLLLA